MKIYLSLDEIETCKADAWPGDYVMAETNLYSWKQVSCSDLEDKWPESE